MISYLRLSGYCEQLLHWDSQFEHNVVAIFLIAVMPFILLANLIVVIIQVKLKDMPFARNCFMLAVSIFDILLATIGILLAAAALRLSQFEHNVVAIFLIAVMPFILLANLIVVIIQVKLKDMPFARNCFMLAVSIFDILLVTIGILLAAAALGLSQFEHNVVAIFLIAVIPFILLANLIVVIIQVKLKDMQFARNCFMLAVSIFDILLATIGILLAAAALGLSI